MATRELTQPIELEQYESYASKAREYEHAFDIHGLLGMLIGATHEETASAQKAILNEAPRTVAAALQIRRLSQKSR